MSSLIPKIDPIAVKVYYTNWRGQTRERHLFPLYIWYGCTAYHSTQWLINCVDLEDGKVKDFALLGFNGTSIYPDRIENEEEEKDVLPEINVIDEIDR